MGMNSRQLKPGVQEQQMQLVHRPHLLVPGRQDGTMQIGPRKVGCCWMLLDVAGCCWMLLDVGCVGGVCIVYILCIYCIYSMYCMHFMHCLYCLYCILYIDGMVLSGRVSSAMVWYVPMLVVVDEGRQRASQKKDS